MHPHYLGSSTNTLAGGGWKDSGSSMQQSMLPFSYYLRTGDTSRLNGPTHNLNEFKTALNNANFELDLQGQQSTTEQFNVRNVSPCRSLAQCLPPTQTRQHSAQGIIANGSSSSYGFHGTATGHDNFNLATNYGVPILIGDMVPLDNDDVNNYVVPTTEEEDLLDIDDSTGWNNNGGGTYGFSANGLYQTPSTATTSEYEYPCPELLTPGQENTSPYSLFLPTTPESDLAVSGSPASLSGSQHQSPLMNTEPHPAEFITYQSNDDLSLLMEDYAAYYVTQSSAGEDVVLGSLGGDAKYTDVGLDVAESSHLSTGSNYSPPKTRKEKGKTSKKLLIGKGKVVKTATSRGKSRSKISKYPMFGPENDPNKEPLSYGERRADSGQKQEYVLESELIKFRPGYSPNNKMALACFTKVLSPTAAKQVSDTNMRRVRLLRSEWEAICMNRNTPEKIKGRRTKFSEKRVEDGENNLRNHLNGLRRQMGIDEVFEILVPKT